MKKVDYARASTFEEASELLKSGKDSHLIAGGTDILGILKDEILKDYPEELIDIKRISNAGHIELKDDKLIIGALAKLSDVAESPFVKEHAPIIAEAAKSVATPLVRNMGTIGGNICQDTRCWFYRYPEKVGGQLFCSRKGGPTCYAIHGDNRYHSIFGGLKTHTSECTRNCPAGTNISEYLEELRHGNWNGAARFILNVNPLPMVTSRICPHPCQDDCNQGEYGECVNIHAVERAVGDYILKNKDTYYAKPDKETGKKIAIVGAGPGGLTAAYYLRQMGHSVTIFDSHEKAGGVLRYGIPHYRLPRTILDEVIGALENMGIVFKQNTIIGDAMTMKDLEKDYEKIFLGTGAWKQPILGINKEELTTFGLDFLTEVNTYLNSKVTDELLVCGGGNVAMDVALTAKRLGVKNVQLVCLEQEHEMPASAEEIARAKEEGVEIFNGWGLKSVLEKKGEVIGLLSKKCLSVFDENGRFNPVYDENDTRTFDASTIILATGQKVSLDFLGDYADQLKTARGLIDVDEDTFQTKDKKIFAGGDAVTGPDLAISAIHAGGVAAKVIGNQLGTTFEAYRREKGFLTYDKKNITRLENIKQKELPVEKRSLTDEDNFSLTMDEAVSEASRCMNCGCYSVNASDISPALVALDATIKTNMREINASDFSTQILRVSDVLKKGEIVEEITIPLYKEAIMQYDKFRIRDSVDFAIASLATVFCIKDNKFKKASVVLGGVAPVPVKAFEVEEFLIGKEANTETAEKAAELVVKNALPMEKNDYKVHEVKVLMKNAILGVKEA